MKLEGYLQIKAAAATLGVSINTLRNWAARGQAGADPPSHERLPALSQGCILSRCCG